MATLGFTADPADQGGITAGDLYLSRWVAGSSGPITSFTGTIRVPGANFAEYMFCLYSDSAGNPGTALDWSARAFDTPSANAKATISKANTQAYSIVSGTTYWIGVWLEHDSSFKYTNASTGTAVATYNNVPFANSPPTLGSQTDFDNDFAIGVYLTYTVPNATVNLTGQASTSGTTAPTVTGVRNPSVSLSGQSITSGRGTPTPDTNYTGYPVTAATALTTVDSVYQGFVLSPADGDRAYFPETVGATPLTPETSSGNATGRISAGPQTGTFTFIYYRLFNNTYYDRQVTLVDGEVTNISLTGQQIQSNSGASFVRVDISKPITGQAITSGQGTPTLRVDDTVTLSSQTLASIVVPLPGTPSVSTGGSVSVGLTGRSITSGQGSVAASGNASPSLTGQQINAGRGNVTVQAQASQATVNLVGQAITSGTSNIRAVGNVIPYYITYHNLEYVLRQGNV